MTVFFVVCTSKNMDGSKIAAVNAAIEKLISATLEYEDDAQIEIAALEFSSGARWITANGPVAVEQFRWNNPKTAGAADFGAACKALNEKLSRKTFMQKTTGYFIPAFFLFFDGKPTDDWRDGLLPLKQNIWFKRAIKVAIGDLTNSNVLKEFTGFLESVIDTEYSAYLEKWIKFIPFINDDADCDYPPGANDDYHDEAAEKGDAEAQYNLGFCYYVGRGVSEDYEKAFYWYTKAAERGHAEAQHCLGLCYAYGEGVPKDMAKAAHWYTKAAEQGHAEAQFRIGRCYDLGTGIPVDKAKAANWYAKAAEKGHVEAQNKLGNCYYKGEGVPVDKAKAFSWYTKAAEQGDVNAQHNLGLCYDEGDGVPQDKAKATYWYKEAACNLIRKGDNAYHSKDYEEAVECYNKAAELGNPDAQQRLERVRKEKDGAATAKDKGDDW